MIYLLLFLIPIVALLAWRPCRVGSGVGAEPEFTTSIRRHALPGGTPTYGIRSGRVGGGY
jgi:hypothetical protein